LWLATDGGLVRFDGVHFEAFTRRNTPAFRDHQILFLQEDRRGNLWAGTYGGGLISRQDGKFLSLTTKDGLASDYVRSVVEDRRGHLWIVTDLAVSHWDGFRFVPVPEPLKTPRAGIVEDREGALWFYSSRGLWRLQGEELVNFSVADGLPSLEVANMALDESGTVWIGTSRGLARFQSGRFVSYQRKDGLIEDAIIQLLPSSARGLWILGDRGTLSRYVSGRFQHQPLVNAPRAANFERMFEDRHGALWMIEYHGSLARIWDWRLTPFLDPSERLGGAVSAMYEDAEGSLWLGMKDGGLERLADTDFHTYTTTHGLTDNGVNVVATDTRGQLWAGTIKGLSRFDGRRFVEEPGVPNEHKNIKAILPARDGGMWFGTVGKLCYRNDEDWTAFPLDAPYPKTVDFDPTVVSILEDRSGDVWVGTHSAGLWRLRERKHWTLYTTENGLPSNYVGGLVQDALGDLWIATRGGGLVQFSKGRFRTFSVRDGLASDSPLTLYFDPDQTLWIGSKGGGLTRFRSGTFTAYTTEDGLYSDYIYQILEDGRQNLWMSSNEGIFRVSKSDLNNYERGRSRKLVSVPYGTEDGMLATTCAGGMQSGGWRTGDGKLWFGTLRGLVVVDPATIQINPFGGCRLDMGRCWHSAHRPLY
jgi:ligand-binding sensor domain-containing protein